MSDDGAMGLARQALTGIVSLSRFGIPLDGSERSAAVQQAIIAAKSGGASGIYIPPGVLGVDRANCIYVPSDFTVCGFADQSVVRSLGNVFAHKADYRYVGQAVFALADPMTGKRYGVESDRRTIGTGATFNVTLNGAAVSAVAIASGGINYTVGDKLLLPNGTVAFVTATGANGTITTTALASGGSGWSGVANPYAHTNAKGQNGCDRIFIANSFATRVAFRDLVLDGQYGFGSPKLTGDFAHTGILVRGALHVEASGLRLSGFSDTGLHLFDVKNARIHHNRASDCGWAGLIGNSRNGFSNIGLYSTADATLNTEYWDFHDNVARKIGDVGSQFALIDGFDVRNNRMLGCGTIGIEGESASFACWNTAAGNNGMRPPGTGRIVGNWVDGMMLDGTLATDNTSNFNAVSRYAFNGISWGQGNEAVVEEGGNYIANLTGNALKIIRNSGGKIIGLGETVIRNVCQGNNPAASPVTPGYAGLTQPTGATINNAQQAVYLQAAELVWGRNDVGSRYAGPGIAISPAGNFLSAKVTDNVVEAATNDTTSAVISFRMSRANSGRFLDFSGNTIDSPQAEAIRIELAGSGNAFSVAYLKVDGVTVRNGNRSNTAGMSAIRITTSGGATLSPLVVSVDRLQCVETSAVSNGLTPVIIDHAAAFAANAVSISNMIAPQFVTKYSISAMAPAPAATRVTGNI